MCSAWDTYLNHKRNPMLNRAWDFCCCMYSSYFFILYTQNVRAGTVILCDGADTVSDDV